MQAGVYGSFADPHNKPLKCIANGGQHLLEMVTDSLGVAKIQAGQMNLQKLNFRFTPQSGRVSVELTGFSKSQMIELTISDTGLVKQLVELHDGTIMVDSEPGLGSRFRVRIPWQTAEGTDEPAGNAEAGASQTAVSTTIAGKPSQPPIGSLILVAEDNASNLSIILDILHFKGYRTVVAKDGAEAVALTHSSKPDLVLMDIQMPKMDGMEATKRLRESAETAVIPIIALTGLAMTGDKERILAAGANDYLSKPIRLKALIEMIEQYLS